MQHRICDYTDRDLAIAIRSPHNSITRQVEIEAEVYKRKHQINEDFKQVQVHNIR